MVVPAATAFLRQRGVGPLLLLVLVLYGFEAHAQFFARLLLGLALIDVVYSAPDLLR